GHPKTAENSRTARYRAQDTHHRAQKLVFKNVSTPIDPAHRRPHHPRGVKNRPLDATPLASPQALGGKPQRTRPSTGRLVDLLIPRGGRGKPQRASSPAPRRRASRSRRNPGDERSHVPIPA